MEPIGSRASPEAKESRAQETPGTVTTSASSTATSSLTARRVGRTYPQQRVQVPTTGEVIETAQMVTQSADRLAPTNSQGDDVLCQQVTFEDPVRLATLLNNAVNGHTNDRGLHL